MHLIADRFAVDDRGHAIDLATGEVVCFVMSSAAGPTEESRWADRCAWLARAAHPSLAQLVDYGQFGEARRFEAWAAQPGWRGAPGAADRARAAAPRFLTANGRQPFGPEDAMLGTRGGRPVVVPPASAGIEAEGVVDPDGGCRARDDRDALGVVRASDRRLAAVADLFARSDTDRTVSIGIWVPADDDRREAVYTLARAARLAGFVPVAAVLADASHRALVAGRSLVVLASGAPDEGWRRLVEAGLDDPRQHIVLFVGPNVVRRVPSVSLQHWSADSLIASVSPVSTARRHLRTISAAARRSGGVRQRFERLLFGDALWSRQERHDERDRTRFVVAPSPLVLDTGPRDTTDRARVAERAPTYVADTARGEVESVARTAPTWPSPGELIRLRRQFDQASALLERGRHEPGERLLRQTMHGFARRGEWTSATGGALMLARALMVRGRVADAGAVLDGARPWAGQGRDLRLLDQYAVARACHLTESGKLVDAERVLDSALASALSAANGVEVDAALALVRCLYWQGRFGDAWQRLLLLPADTEATRRDRVRIWVARSRIAGGRGRLVDAVADAARARDATMESDDHEAAATAQYASALALLAAGDGLQADGAAVTALRKARQANRPLLALCARVLRAEIALRAGVRGPAAVLVRRIAPTVSARLPMTVRARIELLRDIVNGADPADAADHRADAMGLPALRLFARRKSSAPSLSAPAADDVVDLLQCCQRADDDANVLGAVCARLRKRLQASGVAFCVTDGDDIVCVASDGARIEAACARRVIAANTIILPHRGAERTEAGVPVRYAGHVVGVLVALWPLTATWTDPDVTMLLSTGATAAAPALSALNEQRARALRARSSELLGVSAGVAAVRAAIERAANAPFAVLIEGESGTGKELVARLLHKLSARRDRAFAALNCAALPDDLVESELFGHAKGSFTGAIAERRGVFEEAHTGTLFLDEVGELSPRAQAKLLRVIQEGECRRVGENLSRRVDVRLVSATNRDLRAEASAGRFRLDLLYRLDVIRLTLPPLRERREDIVVLAEHFWAEAAARVGSRATLSGATLAALARYNWPGNIRELQNVLASLVVRCPRRGVVSPSALPPHFGEAAAAGSFRLEAARRTFDRSFVRAALVRAGGHRARAAEELGVSRQGLAKLIVRLEIDQPV